MPRGVTSKKPGTTAQPRLFPFILAAIGEPTRAQKGSKRFGGVGRWGLTSLLADAMSLSSA